MKSPLYQNSLALSELYKKMSSKPAGSWMVDELEVPGSPDHTKWAEELQMMRRRVARQASSHVLWVSIAGITSADPRHFKHDYLAPLMTGFHVPVMKLPLRNTREVIKLAGLDSNNSNKTAAVTASLQTNPCFTLPPHLMSSIECQEMNVNMNDDTELQGALEHACEVLLERTAGNGFPVLVDSNTSCEMSTVLAAVQRIVGAALLYTDWGGQGEAREAEVEEWVRRWKSREERRALVTDEHISRGWEADAGLVVGDTKAANLVMRTCAFCILIKNEGASKVNPGVLDFSDGEDEELYLPDDNFDDEYPEEDFDDF